MKLFQIIVVAKYLNNDKLKVFGYMRRANDKVDAEIKIRKHLEKDNVFDVLKVLKYQVWRFKVIKHGFFRYCKKV